MRKSDAELDLIAKQLHTHGSAEHQREGYGWSHADLPETRSDLTKRPDLS